jgi:uncharacterized membrane protein YeaQ/YmgE (transglycosylase-associated protein family)
MFMQVLGLIVAGLIIGGLARLVKPGKQNLSLIMTFVVGIVGALIGGFLASLIGTGDMFELNLIGFIAAVVVAVLLLGVAEALARKRV